MRGKRGLSALPLCLWTCAFVFLPLLYVLFISFLEKGEYFGVSRVFTLDNYARLFSPLYAGILLNSLKIALESTLLSLLIGYPFAWFMANKPPKTRSLIMVLIVIPFWTSALMRTYGWMILLRNRGLINAALMALGVIEKPIRMINTSGAVLLGNLINNQLTVSRDWPFGAALSILMVGMTFCVMSLCRRVGGTDGTEVF